MTKTNLDRERNEQKMKDRLKLTSKLLFGFSLAVLLLISGSLAGCIGLEPVESGSDGFHPIYVDIEDAPEEASGSGGDFSGGDMVIMVTDMSTEGIDWSSIQCKIRNDGEDETHELVLDKINGAPNEFFSENGDKISFVMPSGTKGSDGDAAFELYSGAVINVFFINNHEQVASQDNLVVS